MVRRHALFLGTSHIGRVPRPAVFNQESLVTNTMDDDSPDFPIRSLDVIRQSCAAKLRGIEISGQFIAMLGCLLDENWTTPVLVEMVSTPDGHLLGRCEGEVFCQAFLGETEDLIRNIHGVAKVAELDGDEVGYLVGKVAEIKRQR